MWVFEDSEVEIGPRFKDPQLDWRRASVKVRGARATGHTTGAGVILEMTLPIAAGDNDTIEALEERALSEARAVMQAIIADDPAPSDRE